MPHGQTLQSQLADDVRRGLSARPRSLPPKWFYDAAGSELFDRICELPEYYLTRAERSLLERDAAAIVAATGAVELLEIGSGMARKTGLLLAAMGGRPRYLPFDISTDALEASARSLRAAVPRVIIDPIIGDFERDAGKVPPARGRRLWAFLGSTIGNLDEREAPALLSSFASRMSPGDTFLMGVDLVKDAAAIERAYNDESGVTAAFNKNVLAVINRELDANFALDRFAHHARYRAERIEMFLVSETTQRVRIRAIDLTLDFECGERILTEISRKFTPASAEATLQQSGLRMIQWYASDLFALALAERE